MHAHNAQYCDWFLYFIFFLDMKIYILNTLMHCVTYNCFFTENAYIGFFRFSSKKKNNFIKKLFSNFIIKKWWLRAGSNRRHQDFQSCALPTELPSHNFIKMAVWTGLEPAISSVTDWHVNQLHHQTTWLREKDLNQRPRGYEPRELPAALSRDISVIFTVLYYFTILIYFLQVYFYIFYFFIWRQ